MAGKLERAGKWGFWGTIAGFAVSSLAISTCAFFPGKVPIAEAIVTTLGAEVKEGAIKRGSLAAVASAIATGTAGGTVLGLLKQYYDAYRRRRVIQILGPFQSGKNSVFNTINGVKTEANPTTKGNKSYLGKNGEASLEKILSNSDYDLDRFKSMIEVSGEKDTWFVWKALISQRNPHGIIYVVDSFTCSDNFLTQIKKTREERLEEEIEGLILIINQFEKIPEDKRNLNAFMILVNKIDELDINLVTNAVALEQSVIQDCKDNILSAKMNKSTIKTYLNFLLPSPENILIKGFYADGNTDAFDQYNKSAMRAFAELVFQDK